MKTMPLCAFTVLLLGASGMAQSVDVESIPVTPEHHAEMVRKREAASQELSQQVLSKRRSQLNAAKENRIKSQAVQARHLITVANDYIVEVYKNGKRIPDAKRELLQERFGATAERITVEVRKGDWLVFQVVHNRIRWGGSKYFAVAGLVDDVQIGFVSDPVSQQWGVCDDPVKSVEFIRNRDAGMEVRASAIANPWSEGDMYMKQFVGDGYAGKALWGGASSTWIKFVADEPAPLVGRGLSRAVIDEPNKEPAGEGDIAPEKISVPTPSTPAKPEQKSYRPKQWPVQVLSAIYGTGGKDADVTAKVRDLVETEQRMFSVSPPELGADPNPYWNKSLHIVYMKDGIRREQWRNENEHVLPESFYGPQDAVELTKWLVGTRWFGEKPEIQFHADNTFTSPGVDGVHRWEATANHKIRLIWADERKAGFTFDYTRSSFSEDGNAAHVYHVKN